MSDVSGVSIPRPRPEAVAPRPEAWAESWAHVPPQNDPRTAEKGDSLRRDARLDAVLRRIRKRGKLIRRRSMPLLGGMLAVLLAAAGTQEGA